MGNENYKQYFSAVVWTPYFPTVLDAWANKNHPNMLFLFYEDMKKVKLHFYPNHFWDIQELN
jgi:hypothetical protein